MAVLAECPICHKKQTIKNNDCECGQWLIKRQNGKQVRNPKTKYWIQYRLEDGKQKKKYIGLSIDEAKDADGKHGTLKREGRLKGSVFDVKPESRMSFKELTKWFLGLERVKSLAYFGTLSIYLNKFNSEYGDMAVGELKPADLENLQAKRKAEGCADSTVDQEIGAAKTLINKAFDNEKVGGDVVRVFKKVKKVLKRNSNARDKVLSPDEFQRLMDNAARHTKEILVTAFFTGMRKGEILNLTWDKVDLHKRVIKLEAADTKDKEARMIPICDELLQVLSNIPRPIRDFHEKHVFTYKGKPVRDIRTGLEDACEKAGILYGRFVKDGFVFHDLRHTFNTYMRKAGIAESVIMDITGHSTREMFDRYNTVDADDAKIAIQKFRGFIQSQKKESRENGELG
jgi:integrase